MPINIVGIHINGDNMACKLFIFTSILFIGISSNSYSKDHLIYSIEEEVPMGFEKEVNKKNYFVNIGENQGVEKGTTLDVFRIISKLNPYDNQKRLNHKVKVGEMKILYSSEEASIGRMQQFLDDKDTPLFEIEDFMIGDHVDVSINN